MIFCFCVYKMTNEYNKIIRLYNLDNNKSIIKVAEKDLKEYIKNPSQENRKYLTEDYEEIREKTSKKANAINIKTHDTKMKGKAYIKKK